MAHANPSARRPTVLLTRDQVAQRLGLAEYTLRSWSWRKRAGLPLHSAARELVALEVRAGRTVRYPEDGVLAWLDRRRRAEAEQIAAREKDAAPGLRGQADVLAGGLRGAGKPELAAMVETVGRLLAG
jgi:hypothetical protein